MAAISFDDLVPQSNAPQGGIQQGMSFADLIPKQPQVGDMEDVGKSAAAGLAKDAGYLVNPMGLVRQIAAPVVGGATRLAGAAYEGMGGELPLGIAKWMTNPLGDGSDPNSIIQNQILPALVQEKTGMNMNYQPQTDFGKATNIGVQALPYMMGGGMSIPEVMARAAGIGAGSQLGNAGARSMGFGDKGQEVGSVLGGSAGAFLPEGVQAYQSLPQEAANYSKNPLFNNADRTPPNIPISDAIKQNLLNQNPDVRTYAGEDLAQKLSGAEQNAYTNKEQAYQAANPMLSQATIAKPQTIDFTDKLNAIVGKYDPDLVPAAKSVAKYADEFGSDNSTQPTTLADYEALRQKLNKIPVKDSPTASLVSEAKGTLDDHLNDMASQGLVNGDPAVLKTITDARAKNATWRQQFKSSQANSAIRNFIDKQGGIDSVAPETLLDQFTAVGQKGFDNVRAAQDVLGPDAAPILKQGYLNKIRQASVDANGEIVPGKLQTHINALLQKNPTLSQFVFSPEELQGLQGISNTAGRYIKGAKPGVLGTVVSHIPIAKHIFAPFIESAAKAKMIKNINNPTQ